MKTLFKTPTGDWRFLWKAAFLILGTILANIVFTVLLITIAAAASGSIEQANALAASFGAQIAISLGGLCVMLALVYFLVTKVEKMPWSWSALGLSKTNQTQFIWSGAGFACAIVLLTAGIQVLLGFSRLAFPMPGLFSGREVLFSLGLSALLALTSGFVEEIAFRGYLQSRLMAIQRPWMAVLTTAGLFALAHPISTGPNPLLYLLAAAAVGALFGITYLRTGSLWPGIALHIVWNFIKTAVLASQNAADSRFFGAPLLTLLDTNPSGALLVEVLVILVAITLVLRFAKRNPINP